MSARKHLDFIAAYSRLGTYRGAAGICGLTHKTVKRISDKVEAAEQAWRDARTTRACGRLIAHEIYRGPADNRVGKLIVSR